ncbi:hypothetical protein D0864_01474 [Hortaea werneckii]|uniref:Uncharacterized protein n=1 Tax=Hortaea werneckii TaxID=91943 RepID=A0A3M7H8H0_HORWE|nr:hypothetical protein D0862_08974 [Hortaea werneckii]RMZ09584.1 hypothetical protein D0864_01474 [Hortaea werneckii]
MVVDTSQPCSPGSFTSPLHSRSSYALGDVFSSALLPPKKRRRLEREPSSIVESSSPLTATSDLDRPCHSRNRPMVPRNYQEMPSQLPDSFSESSQQVGMDDMNDLLMMSERQSREVRARMYGVSEAVVSAWDKDDEDATSDSDESECGTFDDSQLHDVASIYWQSILSPDGYAPTPAQTIEVLDTIEKLYLHPVVETDAETGLRAILAIDGLNLPLTSAHEARMGLRKYVFKTNQQGKRVMSRSRIDRLQLFCRRLRKRIQCVPSEYHVRSRVHRLHPVS